MMVFAAVNTCWILNSYFSQNGLVKLELRLAKRGAFTWGKSRRNLCLRLLYIWLTVVGKTPIFKQIFNQ